MENNEKSESSTSIIDDSISKPWQSYHTVYTNAKAGMDGVDKEKVQRIVYEMSKGSKYFENEERKEALMRQKIEHMRARCAKLTTAEIAQHQKVAERRITELETTRDLTRTWLHVDMDAFYAAVETLSNPSLKGKPMAVGGMSMISTANYEARKFGVRAAMPGFIARRLCPELIFVPVDFKKYTYYSSLTKKVYQKYDQNFIAASLDEAYLDITKICREREMSSDEVAEELRRGVFEETGLTCSAGVGPNRLLAKVCSDINKPNGQFILPNDRMAVMTFISSLPIRKIGGIGKVTENVLRDVFEIKTCQDLLQKGGFLCALFSQSSADFFLSVGLGLGSTDTPQVRLRKSMSNERTFSATRDEVFLYQKLAELAEMLSSDLQKEELHGRNLTLKLKTAGFEVRTRAVTLQKYICSSEDILWHAKKLLKAELPASLRLMGLRVSQFSEDNVGPSDPSQKSITSFVIKGDASGRDAHGSDDLKLIDSDVINNIADDYDHFPDGVHLDAFTSDQLSDLGCSSSYISDNDEDVRGKIDPLSNIQARDSSLAPIVHVSELREPDACQSSDIRLPVHDYKKTDTSECTNAMNDDAVPSSSLQAQFQWVDDYKCSICGIEMPLEFVHERQEHSDFHLAERLQQQCSSSNLANHLSNTPKRAIQNDHGSPSRQKKRKSTAEQGKYIPIDKFFKKRTQNM
ncbi:DNA polymerase kappa [Silene latifolia]|uniref:DNA polymerase kappa n=1 Tax=Silene latifolia TaxID=37657 RepID=UPI003D77362B